MDSHVAVVDVQGPRGAGADAGVANGGGQHPPPDGNTLPRPETVAQAMHGGGVGVWADAAAANNGGWPDWTPRRPAPQLPPHVAAQYGTQPHLNGMPGLYGGVADSIAPVPNAPDPSSWFNPAAPSRHHNDLYSHNPNRHAEPRQNPYGAIGTGARQPPPPPRPVEYGRLIVLGYRTHRTLISGAIERVDRNTVFSLTQKPQGDGLVLDERSRRVESVQDVHNRDRERNRIASMSMSLTRDRSGFATLPTPNTPNGNSPNHNHNLVQSLAVPSTVPGAFPPSGPLPSLSMSSPSAPQHAAITFDFVRNEAYDMFQIGRHESGANDFIVPGRVYEVEDGRGWAGPVSRYSFRILCNRRNPQDVRIYASGFNELRTIFLGPRAVRWESYGGDALITYGLAIWKPETRRWVEISAVRGHAFEPRKKITTRGARLPNDDNLLTDGTIIFNAGTTLLFRSTPDPATAPTASDLASHLEHIRANCPVAMDPIPVVRAQQSIVTRRWDNMHPEQAPAAQVPEEGDDAERPWVFVNCGHVFSRFSEGDVDRCPLCRTSSPFKPLHTPHCPPISPAYPTHVLPCGHALSQESALKFLAIPIPGPTDLPDDTTVDWNWRGEPRCPFCGEVAPGGVDAVRKLFFDRGSAQASGSVAPAAAAAGDAGGQLSPAPLRSATESVPIFPAVGDTMTGPPPRAAQSLGFGLDGTALAAAPPHPDLFDGFPNYPPPPLPQSSLNGIHTDSLPPAQIDVRGAPVNEEPGSTRLPVPVARFIVPDPEASAWDVRGVGGLGEGESRGFGSAM